MSMAIARSVLARAARGRHAASQPLLRARAALEPSPPSAGWSLQRNPAANTVGKRSMSGSKGQRRDSIWDKLPDISEYVPLSNIIALVAFTQGMAILVPYTIDNTKRARLDEEDQD